MTPIFRKRLFGAMRTNIARRICVSNKPLFSLKKMIAWFFSVFSLLSAKIQKGASHPHFEERGNKSY